MYVKAMHPCPLLIWGVRQAHFYSVGCLLQCCTLLSVCSAHPAPPISTMPFQLRSRKPVSIATSGLGDLLFPPFLAGTLVGFEKAIGEVDASPESFVKHLTVIQARIPCNRDDELWSQYEKGERVELNRIQAEDAKAIAHGYLEVNEQEMAWYASGDQVVTSEDNKWQPSPSIARRSGEEDMQYIRRLAEECVRQSSASLRQIRESFRSIVGIGSLGKFALADLNATLSANRIRAINDSPVIQVQPIKSDQVGFIHPPLRRDDTLEVSLRELIAEAQRVSSLNAEQCQLSHNQNIKTDLLIEASTQTSSEAVKSLDIAVENLKWAKIGIFLTAASILLSVCQSAYFSHKQAVEESLRTREAIQIRRLVGSSQERLGGINKSLNEIDKRKNLNLAR